MRDNSLGEADYYRYEDYAGFGARLLVWIIDSIVILILGFVLWMVFVGLVMSGAMDTDPSGYFWLLYLLVIWIYLAPIKRSEFGTIGFKLLSVKLVTTQGGRPSLISMTMRMVMWIFGPFNMLVDLLWMGADAEGQSLRDCYLSTYLIKRKAMPIGRAPVHLTRYNAMGFALAYPRVCRPKTSSS